ncbi:hypothetical protein GF374_02180 [Candidatus Woesearchaeota archaeon]|nr:hypothetical protein [Candidatus Woesearchaeota archaeon]
MKRKSKKRKSRKKKTKKDLKKKLNQILGPLVVILIILSMFGIYHSIKIYQPETEETLEVGLVTCQDLGCPDDAVYIGSANSNVYHNCDSSYAQAILPGNRICFSSAEEAEEADYHPAANLQVI